MKVAVTQSISCAHQLPGTTTHGHTYRVTAIYADEVGADGVVVPLEVLTKWLRLVLSRIDQSSLEFHIGPPATAERLAHWIKDQMPPNITAIRVQVGDDGWVETE